MKVWNSPFWKGKALVALASCPVVLKPGGAVLLTVKKGAPAGIATGRCAKLNEKAAPYFVEVTYLGKPAWVWNQFAGAKGVPVKKATAKSAATTKPAAPKPRLSTQQGKGGDGKLCVENIVANDKQTHFLLLQASYYKGKAAQTGVSGIGVTDTALDAELARLTKSYNARQQKLRTSTLLRVQTGISDTVQSWVDALKNLVSGVGVLPLAVVIPVAVVALAGTGYLVWRAFFQDESSSAKDVLAAAKLRDTYQRMSEEEKELFDETVKSAGNAGLKEGQSNWKNMALLAGGGFVLFNSLQGNRK